MAELQHPYATPARALEMADPVEGVSLNATLRSGIDAWVVLPAIRGGRLFGTGRFRVPIRRLDPTRSVPYLMGRDEEVMEWVTAHGWGLAVEAAEDRWRDLLRVGALTQAAAARTAAEREERARRYAADHPPDFFDKAGHLLAEAGGLVKLALGVGAIFGVASIVRALRA